MMVPGRNGPAAPICQKKHVFKMSEKTDHVDRFKAATVAAIKALSEKPELEITFSGSHLVEGQREIILPLPDLKKSDNDDTLRGYADSIALKLRYHNPDLNRKIAPEDNESKALFEALEQARYEALGAEKMAGVARNLDNLHEHHAHIQGFHRANTREDAPLHEALRIMAYAAFTKSEIPESARNIVNIWKPHLDRKFAGADLDFLSEYLPDQQKFGEQVYELMKQLGLSARPASTESANKAADDSTEPDSDTDHEETDECGGEDAKGMPMSPDEQQQVTPEDGAETEIGTEDSPDSGDEQAEEEASATGSPEYARQFMDEQGNISAYRVYTTGFDEIIKAEELCDDIELRQLRKILDKQLVPLQSIISRLANRLQRKLLAQQQRHWKFDLEEGVLDSARLSRIIADPNWPLSYKMESQMEFRDTVVSLLIDNSGSMRGRPITIAAMSADILARTLERCGVKAEILGFTTRTWKGGASREHWLSHGKPLHPGRLNDLRHIIYKSADKPWRHSHNNLALMLREGLLKENIDGEALLWAHSRLTKRPEQRRIMIVISDGAPVDDSTLSANSGGYLEAHLRAVIEWIETRSPVQLMAIGIGHDVTRYYKQAVTLTDAEQLGGALVNELAEMFDPKR